MPQSQIVSVRGVLDITIWVDCPHCEYLINLLDQEDTSGVDLNEEGEILGQACPDGHWSEEHKHFAVTRVECSQCHGIFDVRGLEW